LALIPTTAFAQDEATSENAGIEEIIVTAEFREAKLQDTPIAITAVNAAMLDARSQTNVVDVAAQAPNVTLAPQGQQNGSGLVAFIRGVGQTDFNFALEPGVGMYVDDVYYPTLTGSLLDLMDLDRIEVLRGPQGTLAGKNSIGGAIKLFSSKPDGSGRGSIQATYGSFNRIDIRGFADFSVVEDKLFARVAGVSKNRDGYVKRLDYALSHPGADIPTFSVGNGAKLGTLRGQSYAAGRVSLRWLATEKVEVNVAADYTRDDSEAGASVLLYANHRGTNANGMPWLADSTGAAIPLDCRFVPNGVNSCDTLTGYNRKFVSYGTFTDATPATSQAPYKPFAIDPVQKLDSYGVQGSLDWDISDQFQLKSISSWRRYKSTWAQDVDNSPLANQQLLQHLKHWQWSEELRLNGSVLDDKLDFTLGGFWFEQGGTLSARVDLNYAGIDFVHGPDSTPSTSKALFAHATFHATDALNFSGGLRYSKDEKTYTYFRRNPDGTIPGPLPCAFFLGAPTAGPTGIGNEPNCLLLGLYNISDSFKGDRWDWRVAADYRFSDEFMAYAQVSTGYKGGGVNPRPFFGPSAGALNQLKSFDPETILTYEVGFKSDLFDRLVRLNAAAFYNDYKNIILTLSACPASPCLQPNNVGAAKVKGFEFETTIHPVANLTIDGAFSYLDFQYKKFTANSATLGGLTLDMITPYTPKTKWSAGIQYDFESVLGGTLSARADGSYQSKIYTEAINYDRVVVNTTDALGTQIASNKIDGYFLANARLTWKAPDEDWSVALEVQNLTNKYYFTSLYEQYASPRTVSGAPGLPRTWAVTVKRTF